MKHKILALILALTVVSWAQEATPTAPAAPQQSTAPEKAKCSCCDKMASAGDKAEHSCCAHHEHSADAKESASCCAGKDGKSCCAGKDAKSVHDAADKQAPRAAKTVLQGLRQGQDCFIVLWGKVREGLLQEHAACGNDLLPSGEARVIQRHRNNEPQLSG